MKCDFRVICECGLQMYEKVKCVEKSLVALSTIKSARGRQKYEVRFSGFMRMCYKIYEK